MITSNQINEALENLDNKKIIKKVANKYKDRLSRDELDSCAINAVWLTLQNHKAEFGTKFTSSLYRHMTWECMNAIKANRHQYMLTDIPEGISETPDNSFTKEMLHRLTKKQRELIEERFFLGMTYKEIASKHSWSKAGAKNAVDRILDELRMMCGVY